MLNPAAPVDATTVIHVVGLATDALELDGPVLLVG